MLIKGEIDIKEVAFATATGTVAAPVVAKVTTFAIDQWRTGRKSEEINNNIIGKARIGSAAKLDDYHNFPQIVDNYAGSAVKTKIRNGILYQLDGTLNGKEGRFEWIVQDKNITHRMFVEGGKINGVPIKP